MNSTINYLNYTCFLSMLFIVLFQHTAASQLNPINLTDISNPVELLEINHPSFHTEQSAFVKEQRVFIQLDLGDDYVLGNLPFEVAVNLNLQFKDGEGNPIPGLLETPVNFLLTHDQAEQIYFKDIPYNGLEFTHIYVSDVFVSIETESQEVQAYIESKLSLSAYLDLSYGIGAESLGAISIHKPSQENLTKRLVQFEWSIAGYVFDAYQIQLLKLYNSSLQEPFINDPKTIDAELNWEKSLTLEHFLTQDQLRQEKVKIELPLVEGTGFYAWRVRPILSKYDGGVTNPQNFPAWATIQLPIIQDFNPGEHVVINDWNTDAFNALQTVFYFEDPDEEINWIYQRTFAENNKFSEQMTYADKLLNVRQTQAYNPQPDAINNPNKGANITTQTVLDRSGRPTLQSLPIPKEGTNVRIEKYKNQALVASSDANYSAKHFDLNENFEAPESGYLYTNYYGATGNRVASAGEYPMSRTLYYNDGTGRVKESAGAGETHFIGGRTARYLYGTPSDNELAILFGEDAPAAQTVLKTLAIDANKVPSITYTDANGNTIATCLAFSDESTGLVALDEEEVVDRYINDVVSQNWNSGYTLQGIKRIVFPQEEELKIGYAISCVEFEKGCVSGNCRYLVEISVTDLYNYDHLETYYGLVDEESCVPIDEESGDVEFNKSADPSVDNVMLYSQKDLNPASEIGRTATILLPAGSYQIEKKLYPVDGDQTILTDLDAISETVSTQMNFDSQNSIIQLVRYWYNRAVTGDDLSYSEFIDYVQNFQNDPSNSVYYPDGQGWEDYFDDYTQLPFDELLVAGIAPDYVLRIKMGCCDPITVNLTGKDEAILLDNPERCSGLPGIPTTDELGNGILLPSFECALWSILPEDFSENAYRQLMHPYELGDFDLMISNMINDKYPVVYNGPVESQYTYEELWDCWTVILSSYEAMQASSSSSTVTPYNEVSEDEGAQEDHNQNYDDNQPGGWLLRFILKVFGSSVNSLAEGAQQESMHFGSPTEVLPVPTMFLECTGLRFQYKGFGTSLDDLSALDGTWDNTEDWSDDWLGLPEGIPRKMHPFRYFIYEEGVNLGCEVNNCYVLDENIILYDAPGNIDDINGDGVIDATDEVLLPSCVLSHCEREELWDGTVLSGHQMWDAGQWEYFYQCVTQSEGEEIGGQDPPETSCEETDQLYEDVAALERSMANQTVDCMETCEERQDEFREELIFSAQAAGWTIEFCPPEPIPANVMVEGHIDLIVDELVLECKKQCAEGLGGTNEDPDLYKGIYQHTMVQLRWWAEFGSPHPALTDIYPDELFTRGLVDLDYYGCGKYTIYEPWDALPGMKPLNYFNDMYCHLDKPDCFTATIARSTTWDMNIEFDASNNAPCNDPGSDCDEDNTDGPTAQKPITLEINAE